jgi:hypothetical protein
MWDQRAFCLHLERVRLRFEKTQDTTSLDLLLNSILGVRSLVKSILVLALNTERIDLDEHALSSRTTQSSLEPLSWKLDTTLYTTPTTLHQVYCS